MASVDELLAAARAQQSPLVSLLEGAATGFARAQQGDLERVRQLIALQEHRQEMEFQAQQRQELQALISQKNESDIKAAHRGVAGPPRPVTPQQKMERSFQVGPSGGVTETVSFKEAAPASGAGLYTPEQARALGATDDVVKAFPGGVPKDALSRTAASRTSAARGEAAGFGQAQKLRKEFIDRPEVKDYVIVSTNVGAMDAMLEKALTGGAENKVAVDQALISLYNKLTDPTSVIRESEYARTPENLPVVNRITAAIEKVGEGGAGLTDDDRKALVDGAKVIAEERKRQFDRSSREYGQLASRFGIDPSLVTGTLSELSKPGGRVEDLQRQLKDRGNGGDIEAKKAALRAKLKLSGGR